MTSGTLASLRKGKKVRFESPDELLSILSDIYNSEIVIQRLEAFRKRGDDEIADLDHSIINLDGDDNWRNHEDVDRMFRLLKRKISGMKQTSENYVLSVWAEPWPQDHGNSSQFKHSE